MTSSGSTSVPFSLEGPDPGSSSLEVPGLCGSDESRSIISGGPPVSVASSDPDDILKRDRTLGVIDLNSRENVQTPSTPFRHACITVSLKIVLAFSLKSIQKKREEGKIGRSRTR